MILPQNFVRLVAVAVLFACFAGYSFMEAGVWTSPAGLPPTNNVDMPLNTGSTAQYKNGTLSLVGNRGDFNASGTIIADENIAGNILAAFTEVRSDKYCNATGDDCISLDDINIPTIPTFTTYNTGSNPQSVLRNGSGSRVCSCSAGDSLTGCSGVQNDDKDTTAFTSDGKNACYGEDDQPVCTCLTTKVLCQVNFVTKAVPGPLGSPKVNSGDLLSLTTPHRLNGQNVTVTMTQGEIIQLTSIATWEGSPDSQRMTRILYDDHDYDSQSWLRVGYWVGTPYTDTPRSVHLYPRHKQIVIKDGLSTQYLAWNGVINRYAVLDVSATCSQ